MDNYIGKIEAEWVDPAVELPPDGWRGLAINSDGDVVYATAHVPRVLLSCLVAWLRISGPSDAIPREAVQAAVDAIHSKARYWMADGAREAPFHEVGDQYNYMASGLSQAMKIIETETGVIRKTGVTPTEVQ
jgi:hypothetical protein